MTQTETGKLTEWRVKQKLESFGLKVIKPIPDVGIDFNVFNPKDTRFVAKIQVKGRNPTKIKSYRWFQLRVQKRELDVAKKLDIPIDETWQNKVRMIDFFIFDDVFHNEMWLLTQEQTFQLISLNEFQYGNRPDNVFVYSDHMKSKHKEMNFDARVPGISITERFESCKNNFMPLLNFLQI